MSLKHLLLTLSLILSLAMTACGPAASPAAADTHVSEPVAPSETAALATDPTPGWIEYRDPRYGYGLAMPCYWTVYPTMMEGMLAAMTAFSYSDEFFGANSDHGQWKDGVWPPGAMKMDVIGIEQLDPALSPAAAVQHVYDTIAAGQEILEIQDLSVGRPPGVMATVAGGPQAAETVRIAYIMLEPGTMISVNLYPIGAIDLPDAQAMLASLSASPDEPIVFPAGPPSGPPDGGSATCQ